jgi:hypothetical protein
MGFNISNSLIRAYHSYLKGELCGEYFRAVYIDKDFEPKPTQPMMIGHRFEYLVTGSLLRDGSIPPDVVTSSKGNKVAAMSYVERFVDVAKKSLHPLGVGGVKREIEIDGLNYKGIYDWFAEGEIIQDIKTSGNIDRHGDYGWKDISEGQQLNQARFYTWLEWKLTSEILPFEFHLYSTAPSPQAKIIPVSINEDSLKRFEDSLIYDAHNIVGQASIGFEPISGFSTCTFCPLKGKCEFMSDKIHRDEVVVA